MNDEQRPHHDYSPSTLQSLEACPCWQGKQSDTPHPRTVIGQISHGVTETGEDDPRLTDEDTDKVAECIDFYEQRKKALQDLRKFDVNKKARERYARMDLESAELLAEGAVQDIQELKETYLAVDSLLFSDVLQPPYGVPGARRTVVATTGGYIDSGIIDHTGTYGEIFDWKFGFWPVEQAENNLQGIAYALGMFKRFPNLRTVKYFFKQPNLDYITDATITRENVPALYLRIQVVVARARAARRSGDFSTARAMVPACNFCAHVGICPVVTGFACKTGSKFYPLEIPADITPTMVHNPKDTKLGLQLASVLEVWAKAFRGVITNRVICRDAEPPDGYTLESRNPRTIKDAVKYRAVALKYLTPAEFDSTLKVTFGTVEKIISDKAPRGQKELQVKLFGVEAEECGAVERSGGYTFLRAVPSKPTNK